MVGVRMCACNIGGWLTKHALRRRQIIFGAVVEDGWGIWYGFEDHMIRMMVTGGPKAPVNAAEMSQSIQDAMRDVWKLWRAGKPRL